MIFRTVLAFLIFDPNWPFCMGCSPCIFANFGHFQNALIFRTLGVLGGGFLQITILMWSYNDFLAPFWNFKLLTQTHHFAIVYSPCILANFGHFENALICRILGVLWSGFFAHNNSNVVVQSFFASFWHF